MPVKHDIRDQTPAAGPILWNVTGWHEDCTWKVQNTP
jgi:hypothetical protein